MSMVKRNTRDGWFRFRVITLLMLLVVISVGLKWVTYSLAWIRERHFRDGPAPRIFTTDLSNWHPGEKEPPCWPWQSSALTCNRRAPRGLWLFGEVGYETISCKASDVEFLTRLFPEAEINADRK